MTCTKALLSIFLLAPCDDSPGGAEAVSRAVNNPQRPAADVQRDPQRKPAGVLSFLGIKPGMEVLEVFSGGGYYTQILDAIVGEDGRLIAHNNGAYLDYLGAQYQPRFDNGWLPNTEAVVSEANDLELPKGELDAALLVLVYHDFLFSESVAYQWPDVDEHAFLDKLCDAMKPGAVLGIVDHIADPGGDASAIAKTIHRIDPERVKDDVTSSCFDLEAESFVLRNLEDDHSTNATAPDQIGSTDRFVFKFVRR